MLSILISLSILALIIFFKKTNYNTINKDEINFAVEDTAAIDKIFIANKNNEPVILERLARGWVVNCKYNCFQSPLNLLLYTIKAVKVKSPVPKSQTNHVLKVMSSQAIKIEFYNKKNKIKEYYVGHTTQDYLGTYMLLHNTDDNKNYDTPYITHIPGFEGFLNTRYITNEADWRDRTLISIKPPQTQSIKLFYLQSPDSSFQINLVDAKKITVTKGKNINMLFDDIKTKRYLTYFMDLNFEYPLEHKSKDLDSLKKFAKPFATLQITDIQNKTKQFDFYYKQINVKDTMLFTLNKKHDSERLYVKFKNELNQEDYAVIQYYSFGKIFQSYRYFLTK